MSALDGHLTAIGHEIKFVTYPACIQGKCTLCEVVMEYPGIEYRCNCRCHSDSGGLK